jgi:spore coat protein CotH
MHRLLAFVLLIFSAATVWAQDPGDGLFSRTGFRIINIVFDQPNWWDTLVANKLLSDQTLTDIYIPGKVIIDGDSLDSVGVRLKGNASYNHPGTKKPIRLELDEYIGNQKYDGLTALHLNNSAFDPTMLREKLMLDALRNQGVPAPRCSFALVYYNGVFTGVYNLVEHIDKKFLQTHFNDDRGNLYKGDPNGTLEWHGASQSGYYSSYELKTNEAQNDWSDLVSLIDVIHNSGTDFPNEIRQHLDVEAFLKYLAAQNVFGNMDSYVHNPHNYYLYHDSIANRFEWIAWDVGLSFGVFPNFFSTSADAMDLFYVPDQGQRTPLTVKLFEYEEFRKIYLDAVCTFLSQEFNSNVLFPKIDSMAAILRPWIYSEPSSNKMYSAEQFEGNLGYSSYSVWILSEIPGLKQFIGKRSGNLSIELCESGWSCIPGTTASTISGDAIHIAPNPVTGTVTVSFDSPDSRTAVYYRITDMQGRIILQENVLIDMSTYSRTLDFSNYASGTYVLRVLGTCDEIVKKIVVIH